MVNQVQYRPAQSSSLNTFHGPSIFIVMNTTMNTCEAVNNLKLNLLAELIFNKTSVSIK